jgi:hypothetical protein
MTKATSEDVQLAQQIADRTMKLCAELKQKPPRNIVANILFVHENIIPLRLEELAKGEMFELVHDVFGIDKHLDRRGGKLTMGFLPRYAYVVSEVK